MYEWLIVVGGGYGSMRFIGTKEEAEQRRRLKARHEGAVARLTCLGEVASTAQ